MGRKETNNRRDLPHDIISLEILSRLPIESIYRCRSVCKLWYALPHDAKFVQTHSERSLYSSKIIIMSYKDEKNLSILSFYSFDMAESGNKTKLLFTVPLYLDDYLMEPPCEGLVCFSAVLREDIYVCNPSTHELQQLPRLIFYHAGEYSNGNVAGFGFDQLTRKHKVLFAFQSLQFNSSKCFLLTLGSIDGWRQVDDIPYQIQEMQSAYLNGRVYWLIVHPIYYKPNGILSFNFQDEKYQVLPVPNCEVWRSDMDVYGSQSDAYLKGIGGYLRLVATVDGLISGWWVIKCWTLKDPTNPVWTFEFWIVFDITCDSQIAQPPMPVDIQNGKVVLSAGGKLHVFDVKEEVSQEIVSGIPDEDDAKIPKNYQADYVESLNSPVVLHALQYQDMDCKRGMTLTKIRICRLLLMKLWGCRLHNIYREVSEVADDLLKRFSWELPVFVFHFRLTEI